MHSLGQNTDPRKKDENKPSRIHRFPSKSNDERNTRRKVKVCREISLDLEEAMKCTTVADLIIQIKDQYNITIKEIGAKLIALADAFDDKFFGDSSISKK
ncbi:hypothetical protein WUBG_13992 [Wuchereria bancrofti]|uniref:Uncharacterized protein n=1 Tax=Wuchereria bancrofti TaxID=6293 RepID=J9ALI2_WUCBA|nr:hypothetical protein WUBG_13992 [Wuchereria bancrofti]VDM06891.1 unnamed protein product [Wuchereria bancrofti]